MNFLNRKTILLFGLAASLAPAQAEILNAVGQVMPMIHINLEYNSYDDIFSVSVDNETPVMTPLSVLQPGDSFAPSAPWYNTLDPSQEGQAWTRRYGFVNTGDPLPVNQYYWIVLDVTTAGIGAYYYAESPATFAAMFGTEGSTTLWQYPSAMYHPVFTSAQVYQDLYSVTGTAYIGDASGLANPDYDPQSFTLNFSSVPEPQTYAALFGVLTLGLALYFRNRRS